MKTRFMISLLAFGLSLSIFAQVQQVRRESAPVKAKVSVDKEKLACEVAKNKLLNASKNFLLLSGKNINFYQKNCKPHLKKMTEIEKTLSKLYTKRASIIPGPASASLLAGVDGEIKKTKEAYENEQKAYKGCKTESIELEKAVAAAKVKMDEAKEAKVKACGK